MAYSSGTPPRGDPPPKKTSTISIIARTSTTEKAFAASAASTTNTTTRSSSVQALRPMRRLQARGAICPLRWRWQHKKMRAVPPLDLRYRLRRDAPEDCDGRKIRQMIMEENVALVVAPGMLELDPDESLMTGERPYRRWNCA
jgi:hypothetical protein